MERSTFRRNKLVAKCLAMVLSMGVGIVLMVISILSCREYRDMSSRSMVVDAVITEVRIYSDSENGDDYRVYVTYACEGKEYTRLHLSVKDKSWMERVGQSIKVIVDPLNPTVEPSDMENKIFFTMFFGLPIFCAGTLTCFMSARRSCVAMNGLQDAAIRRDMLDKERRKVYWLPFFLYAIGETAFAVYAADIDRVFSTGYLLSAMVLPFGIVFLVKHIRAIRSLKSELCVCSYSVSRYKVNGKKKDNDGESTSYYIYYYDGKGNAPVSVSKKAYDLLEINDELVSVRLLSKKVFGTMSYGYDPGIGYYDVT